MIFNSWILIEFRGDNILGRLLKFVYHSQWNCNSGHFKMPIFLLQAISTFFIMVSNNTNSHPFQVIKIPRIECVTSKYLSLHFRALAKIESIDVRNSTQVIFLFIQYFELLIVKFQLWADYLLIIVQPVRYLFSTYNTALVWNFRLSELCTLFPLLPLGFSTLS